MKTAAPRTSPPLALLRGASLFLDLDGTLLDLVDRPDSVRADAPLLALLERVGAALDGRLAVVSGRSLAQIEQILGASAARAMALSGSHGCEQRWQGVVSRPERPSSLDRAAERLRAFADETPGVLVEDKSFGAALHYRMNPAAEAEAGTLAAALADELDLALQPGKMMVELRLSGSDKGEAVRTMMAAAPFAGTVPLFAGDDLTDEPGFAAARALGGDGILIGEERASAAAYRLASPAALRRWLMEASA